MDKNIFEGAKFGNIFICKDNSLAVYIGKVRINEYYFVRKDGEMIYTNEFGIDKNWMNNGEYDIVSKYHEEIDEEKLDELAFESASDGLKEYWYNSDADSYRIGFKAGYRKATEE